MSFSSNSNRLYLLPFLDTVYGNSLNENSLYIFDLRTGVSSRYLLDTKGEITAMAVSRDERGIAVAIVNEGRAARTAPAARIVLHSLSPARQIGDFVAGVGPVRSLDLSSTGELLAYCGSACAVIKSLVTDRAVALTATGETETAIAFSPDERFVAVGRGDGSVCVVELISCQRVVELDRAQGAAYPFRFSDDGLFMAGVCAAEQAVLIWDLATGRIARRISDGDTWYPYDVVFIPRTANIATSDSVPTMRLWNSNTGDEIARTALENHQPIAASSDGRLLASSGRSAAALIWEIEEHTESNRHSHSQGEATETTTSELQAAASRLGANEACAAYASAQLLVAAGDIAVPYLAASVRPQVFDDEHIHRLIQLLDADGAETRRRAYRELTAIMPACLLQISAAIASTQSAETCKSLKRLKAECDGIRIGARDVRRSLRAIYALERIGTAHAINVLTKAAQGHRNATVTKAAVVALNRLRQLDFASARGQ